MGNNVEYCCGSQRKQINFEQIISKNKVSKQDYINNLIEFLNMQESTCLQDNNVKMIESKLEQLTLDFNDDIFQNLLDHKGRLSRESIGQIQKITGKKVNRQQYKMLNDYIKEQMIINQSVNFDLSRIDSPKHDRHFSFAMDDSINYSNLFKHNNHLQEDKLEQPVLVHKQFSKIEEINNSECQNKSQI